MSRVTASLTLVLVQQHARNERERIAAEQFVGGVVLADAEGRHGVILPHGRRSAAARGVGRELTTFG